MKKSENIKIGKTRYPDKRSINLLIQDRNQGNTKLQIFVFVIFLLILAIFVKFMVVDKLAEGYAAQQNYIQMEQEIAELQEANKNYDQVRGEYSHYGNGYLNDEEKAEMDRMTMLDVIDKEVIAESSIQSIEISGNAATVTIDSIRLKKVSEIVDSLQQNEKVSYVTVSTAGTNTESNAVVSATLIINFESTGGDA